MAKLLSRRRLVVGACAIVACRDDPPAKPPPPVLELWFGGDVHVGGDAPQLQALSRVFGDAIGVVNLEGAIGGAPFAETRSGVVRLANEEATVSRLASLGVNVVTIANNHMADRGRAGEDATRAALARAKLRVAGRSAGAATIRAGKRRVVVSAHELPSASVVDELRSAAKEADILAVSFHVTGPPSYIPKPLLREAVDHAVRAGARVVVAHGTHVLGPVERRGDVVIAWGLGNLLFSCDCTKETEGAILRVRIEGERTLARIIPIDAGLMGAAAKPTREPKLMLELLQNIGSTPLQVGASEAAF
jgi:poly-gamma-glutamate capsule biosynthesis protein CapA/YwtB (metallophosphatase superfamily)